MVELAAWTGIEALNCETAAAMFSPTDANVMFVSTEIDENDSGGMTVTTDAFAAGADVLTIASEAGETGRGVATGDSALAISTAVRASMEMKRGSCRVMLKCFLVSA